MKKRIKIAFLGSGHIAQAIIASMTNPASVDTIRRNGKVFDITAVDIDDGALARVSGLCAITRDAVSAVGACDYIIIAVKPQDAKSALASLNLSEKTVISVMAGISISSLSELTGAKKIVRVMPNICARVGESYNAYSSVGIDADGMETVLEILGAFGVPRPVDENLIPAVTGLTGSAPAYIFMAVKALTDEGIAQGFDAEAAKAMAVQTVIGSALTAECTDLDGLIKSVCSQGGTTAEGVKVLEERGYGEALREAVRASIKKSKELAQ